jgi:hypothetical protein
MKHGTAKRLAAEIPDDERRKIPLDMLQEDVARIDRAAKRAGLSRAEWCRRVLNAAAAAGKAFANG